MKITITGPRSVGKSTISKIVAKKLGLKYYSSDEIGEKVLKKQGGLDKGIKSSIVGKFIKKGNYNLIREVYKKDNFVFDISGGSISSRKYAEASKKVRETVKKNSIVVGLLPSKNIKESIKILLGREKGREHFRNMNPIELSEKVEEDYKKFPELFKELCNFIIYTENKTLDEIAEEIINNLKKKIEDKNG
jgi:shikimate kinase